MYIDCLLSFVVCTHNPCFARLQRVLNSLRIQKGVAPFEIETIVVDNRSDPPLLNSLNFEYSDGIRLVEESKPGLTFARVKGFKVSKGNLLVFVDDDNILSSSFVANLKELMVKYPQVGVFSSGSICPELQGTAPVAIEQYWKYLAIVCKKSIEISSDPRAGVLPVGAGMVVRRPVMEAYAGSIEKNPSSYSCDRDGHNLYAAGDTEIGLTALSIGYQCGFFPQLKLKHVIGEERLTQKYLDQVASDVTYSTNIAVCKHSVWPVNWGVVFGKFVRAMFATLMGVFVSNRAKRYVAWARFRAFLDFQMGRNNN